ncbi:hypothetical protein GCM10010215_42970 [Streptomyces virginiae]|uniref:Uncharacterized protein n=1 Tax=Streptomyces virginiae TaxID=1961 RepID=A0ABQ3NYB5_STRVG|nr:hypothetical protein GCM10010215_42970 [Streptomyces virginiae]GHI17771.1 hypothetical protein Scinn_72340 [Streptomyces virginiae]GLV91239.1 hypothetical protein Slala04_26930 [Streptomyces lavendulae subsp. lavendulae]
MEFGILPPACTRIPYWRANQASAEQGIIRCRIVPAGVAARPHPGLGFRPKGRSRNVSDPAKGAAGGEHEGWTIREAATAEVPSLVRRDPLPSRPLSRRADCTGKRDRETIRVRKTSPVEPPTRRTCALRALAEDERVAHPDRSRGEDRGEHVQPVVVGGGDHLQDQR